MGTKSRYREVLKSLSNRTHKNAKSTYPPNTRPVSLKGRPDDTARAYEFIPTEKELADMESFRLRSATSAILRAYKPAVERPNVTLANATREQVVDALHKIQSRKKDF